MNHFMTLGPAKHEEVAFMRIPNVLELRELLATEQFVSSVRGKFTFDPNIILIMLQLFLSSGFAWAQTFQSPYNCKCFLRELLPQETAAGLEAP